MLVTEDKQRRFKKHTIELCKEIQSMEKESIQKEKKKKNYSLRKFSYH